MQGLTAVSSDRAAAVETASVSAVDVEKLYAKIDRQFVARGSTGLRQLR